MMGARYQVHVNQLDLKSFSLPPNISQKSVKARRLQLERFLLKESNTKAMITFVSLIVFSPDISIIKLTEGRPAKA
jgi:translation initiation factor IF-3